MPPPVRFVGARIKRLEDPRLLAGGGRYVDDLARPGAVHAVVCEAPTLTPTSGGWIRGGRSRSRRTGLPHRQ